MVGITTIAGISRLSIRIEALEASRTVEAIGTTTLNSWNLTVIAKPAIGTFLREERSIQIKLDDASRHNLHHEKNSSVQNPDLDFYSHNTDSFHRVPTKNLRSGHCRIP